MGRPNLPVRHRPIRFQSDATRVITRLFLPGDGDRIGRIVQRVADLSDQAAEKQLAAVLTNFSTRHRDIEGVLTDHFARISARIESCPPLSPTKKLLVGAYFTMEYSIESAALFNPSIVLAPEIDHPPPGHARIILTFRATGEGHISSLEFRRGSIDERNEVMLEPTCPYLEAGRQSVRIHYDKNLFGLQLLEMNAPEVTQAPHLTQFLQRSEAVTALLTRLEPQFTLEQLERAEASIRAEGRFSAEELDTVFTQVYWLAHSNYEMRFDADTCLSERVIFPISENESRGIEDARFVRFVDDDGHATYYATYTAYDGRHVRTQLLETRDFEHFRISTLNGKHANSKGMALFPRKVGGKYAMISRIDGENLFLMYSDDIRFWHRAEALQEPRYPWEYVQIGNCGSPIETTKGWLLLTHGVGPMRTYSIGVTLLDRKDPSKVLGRLAEPVLVPEGDMREGYVPNVVYTCGSLVHNGELIIPYAMSDSASSIASVPLDALLKALRQS